MVLEHLYKTNRVIGGTSSADSIIAYEADRVTIRGLEGNDTLTNGGYRDEPSDGPTFYYGGINVLIEGGAGNDSIYNNSTLNLTPTS